MVSRFAIEARRRDCRYAASILIAETAVQSDTSRVISTIGYRRMPVMAPLLLYDGTCGFCAASVVFILRHERQHTLRFATLEGAIGSEIRRRHPDLERVDSIVWVDPPARGHPEAVFVKSQAAMRAARYLGGSWRLLAIGKLLPVRFRDGVYDWIARHRHSISSRGPRCVIPTLDQAPRFLDRDPA
jgi:predicted DCC family thiol-disulfide oxidoreductase YuxK